MLKKVLTFTLNRAIIYKGCCRCVGMADETDSKSVVGDHVWVQVPPPAPETKHPDIVLMSGCFFAFHTNFSIQISIGQNKKSSVQSTKDFGVPGGIRTPDLLVRSQSLYPAELQAHCSSQRNILYHTLPRLSSVFFKKIRFF